ncbi:GAF domain-containing protein [Kineococcus auxinigenes]|uniref:GAF domain-containing protein n=1 Tax=unclassified Kineococcus TaxID=2621656 RepID=UPI003D7F1199
MPLPRNTTDLPFEDACAQVLDFLRQEVPLGHWSISRYDGERQVHLQLRDDAYGVRAGDHRAWDTSLCARMVAGAPRIAPDVAAVAQYANAPVRQEAPIGAYVGIPLHDADGGLFGTICGLDPNPQGRRLDQHAPVLELLGSLLTAVLRAERSRDRTRQLTRWTLGGAAGSPLKGVVDRGAWYEFLTAADEQHRVHGDPARVAVFQAADETAAARVAQLLRQNLREHDVVAVLGAGEVGVVLTRIPPVAGELCVGRLQRALADAGLRVGVGSSAYSIADGFAAAWARAESAARAGREQRTAA